MKLNSSTQPQKWVLWSHICISWSNPFHLPLEEQKKERDFARSVLAMTGYLQIVKRLKEISHFSVSVIILPAFPNPVPDLGDAGHTFRKPGQGDKNCFWQEINQCIWVWAVMPKLVYHNKWFHENVLVNTAHFAIWGVVAYPSASWMKGMRYQESLVQTEYSEKRPPLMLDPYSGTCLGYSRAAAWWYRFSLWWMD